MDGSITTNKGIALIGKLLAQKGALQITRVAVGDGTPPASPATLNALVHELKNATIESVDNPKNGEAKIVVTVSSIGVTQGFFVKEIGVFAKDTDGKEILYAYAGFSDNPQWIRPEGTAITNVATYDINSPWNYREAFCSTVVLPSYELGVQTAQALLYRLENGTFESSEVVLPVSLLEASGRNG